MINYFIRRLFNGFFVIIGVVVVIFFLFTILPADPARMMLGQRADSVSVALINKDLGLDLPAILQFGRFVNDLSPISFFNKKENGSFFFDTTKYGTSITLLEFENSKVVLKAPYLRRSYQNKKNVSSIILEKLPDTVVLAFAAILFATLLGLILGIIAALKKNSVTDKLILLLSLSGVSVPSFLPPLFLPGFLDMY